MRLAVFSDIHANYEALEAVVGEQADFIRVNPQIFRRACLLIQINQ